MVLFTDGWGHTPRCTVRLSVFPPTPHTQPVPGVCPLHWAWGTTQPGRSRPLGLLGQRSLAAPSDLCWPARSSCHLENMWPDNLRAVGSELWAPRASVWWTKALETGSGAGGFGERLALPTVGSQACLGEGPGLSAWGSPTLCPRSLGNGPPMWQNQGQGTCGWHVPNSLASQAPCCLGHVWLPPVSDLAAFHHVEVPVLLGTTSCHLVRVWNTRTPPSRPARPSFSLILASSVKCV